MVGILIRMKLTILRRSPGGFVNWKTIVGLVLAISTILIATRETHSATVATGLLAMALGSWTLGWVLAPIQTGAGADEPIMPEHFSLLPIPPSRLATGLLAAAFVGMGPLITLIAFSSLMIFGLKLWIVPALVSIVAMPLQLALAILLSKVVIGAASSALKSRFGMEFAALQYAIIVSLSTVGWMIPAALAGNHNLFDGPKSFLTNDLPSSVSFLVRASPSGWGPVAVDAAHESHWLLMIGALLGLAATNALLLLVWGEQLRKRMTTNVTRQRSSRPGMSSGLRRLLPDTPLGASIGRELRSWSREPRNALELRIAILTGLLIVLIPAALNWTQMVPWVGVIIALLAAACSCNQYGLEGSSFWLTLMTPHAEETDVRGKQWAFLIVFGPLAFALTVLFTAWGEQTWAWPWVLAILPAALGAGAGVMMVVSIRGVVPVPMEARRSGNLMAAADNTGQTFLAMILVSLATIPAALVVFSGLSLDIVALEWLGVPVGVATGVLIGWWGRRIAIRDLQTKGPELLTLLRYGHRERQRRVSSAAGGLFGELPQGKAGVIVVLCWSLFWLPLIPQGLLPLALKVADADTKSWCVALYLPSPYQWPTITIMIVIGLVLIWVPIRIQMHYNRSISRRPQSPQPTSR
ncbi:MAG: hypothetical protein ACR2OU_11650 [Thermomicrobiales bacterium]